jgi:4-diphosphocytidyl-2-C-methyl-D-erythritol kinase
MTERPQTRAIAASADSSFVLRAHAKINLRLEVVGVRPDGYHLLRTVFQTLALHDEIAFQRRVGPFALSCDDPQVPADRKNLVWKAADLVWTAAGRHGEPAGVRVEIAKRIPPQGGLGGGSSDAAAALVGLDAVWQADLGEARLSDLARRLGADVPFFLCGGTALGVGRGDVIEPMPDAPARDVVLVSPPFGVSTPEAFRWYDEDTAAGADPGTVLNALERPVSRRHPEIAAARRALEEAGAEVAAMSGSGSTVFGLFPTGRGEAAADRLSACGWRTLLTATAPRDAARP